MFVSMCSGSETECAENAEVDEIVTGIRILMGWHNTQETPGISFLAALRAGGQWRGGSVPAEGWTLYIKMSGRPLRGGGIWMRPEWWEQGDQSGVGEGRVFLAGGRNACLQCVSLGRNESLSRKALGNLQRCAGIHFHQSSFWVRWPCPTIPKRLPRGEGLFYFFEIFQHHLSFFCGISFVKASFLSCRECT